MNTGSISKDNAQVIRTIIKNVDGSGSIETGMGVALVQAGASIDGISAVKLAAGNVAGFAGVAIQDIAINAIGTVTASGYVASVLISHEGSSITVTAGDLLKPSAVAGAYASSITNQALSTVLYKYVIAGNTTVAISAAAYVTGIVKGGL